MARPTPSPRIVFFDIETAPTKAFVWGFYETNVIKTERDWYILSFAAKVVGEKKVRTWALPDYSAYAKDRENDKALCKDLWRLLDGADIVVAHNGDRFDVKKANTRFLVHGFDPPSPYKTIDTLKMVKGAFSFDSNKLDNLGKFLNLGGKLPHTGAHLWFGCMAGNARSWRLMRKYNARDVELLEKLYLKLRPWAKTHPDLRIYERASGCPTCKSMNTQRRGQAVSRARVYQRFQCNGCGAWFSGDLIKA